MVTASQAAHPLTPCCGVCNSEKHLLKCAGCKVMRYCTKEHQAADWPQHKAACSRIKKSRSFLDREQQTLLREEPDIFSENNVGHFWGLVETRPYMRSRYGVVEATLKVKTFDAVESALDHIMDMLRLCRGDNMGVRDLAPHLMLRLGRYQDCYDFIRWWKTCDPHGTYDWGDTSLPYLNLKNEDVYESVDYLCDRYPDLSYTVATTLMKIKLLLFLKNYQGSTILHEIKVDAKETKSNKLPAEIVDQIRSDLLKGGVVGDLKGREPAQLITDLSSQIEQLIMTVKKANKHFWPALLDPGRHINARPEAYIRGSVEEMQIKLHYSADAWQENPDALAYIRNKAGRGQ